MECRTTFDDFYFISFFPNNIPFCVANEVETGSELHPQVRAAARQHVETKLSSTEAASNYVTIIVITSLRLVAGPHRQVNPHGQTPSCMFWFWSGVLPMITERPSCQRIWPDGGEDECPPTTPTAVTHVRFMLTNRNQACE
jgi:hypothetical protein